MSAWIEIDDNALRANVQAIRDIVGHRPILAVVKANAYGHGLVGTSRVFAKEGIEAFGVSSLQEAVQLREAGISGSVVLLSPITVESDMEQAVASSIEVTICTTESLEALRRFVKNGRLRQRCQVQIKVDTGMSRLGFSPETAL